MEKTKLNPEEKLEVARRYILGREKQDDMSHELCINIGRVNEACRAIRFAIEHTKIVAKLAKEHDDKNGKQGEMAL